LASRKSLRIIEAISVETENIWLGRQNLVREGLRHLVFGFQ
jgi:hypothetical protein